MIDWTLMKANEKYIGKVTRYFHRQTLPWIYIQQLRISTSEISNATYFSRMTILPHVVSCLWHWVCMSIIRNYFRLSSAIPTTCASSSPPFCSKTRLITRQGTRSVERRVSTNVFLLTGAAQVSVWKGYSWGLFTFTIKLRSSQIVYSALNYKPRMFPIRIRYRRPMMWQWPKYKLYFYHYINVALDLNIPQIKWRGTVICQPFMLFKFVK